MSPPIRTLIVDDDAIARGRIATLVAADAELVVAGECANGADAIRQLRDAPPDLVFLDVQMPGVDGFGVVEAIGAASMPVTVFVSAHVEFALHAFDAYALDYLLKPFDEERFRTAVERAKEAVRSRRTLEDPRIAALISFMHAPESPRYPETLAIKAGSQHRFIPVAEIDYLEADGNHIVIHSGTTQRTLHKSLTALEQRVLDPDRFVRIHRSTIVNLARIAFVEPVLHGDLTVTLQDGTRLPCSRRFRARLQEKVHFSS
ncbi:MAG TPA: LytTR family DNA-binding domain-containing protein [Longimicrobium sp.]|jgi:two-component system LytT family response regulator